jgi:probable HAF family extracellular repeat protein
MKRLRVSVTAALHLQKADGTVQQIDRRGSTPGPRWQVRPRLFTALALAALVLCTPPSVIAQGSVIDIDPLGPLTSFLTDVNNRGQAAGRQEMANSDNMRAVLWEKGHLTYLGGLPDYPKSAAAAINERGQIVGWAVGNNDFLTRAVLWDRGRIVDLTPPGWYQCAAYDINNRGDIVGTCTVDSSSLGVAVLWRRGMVSPLGVLPGYLDSSANAINDAGVVIGTLSNHLEDRMRAFRWAAGEMSELPLPPGAANSFASAINASGTIVGTASGEFGARAEPVIWQGGAVLPLGVTWGSVLGSAFGINDRGDVVGTFFDNSAFVWSAGTFKQLDSPYGALPLDINEGGMAVGFIFTTIGGSPAHGAVWPKASTRVP